MLTFPRLVMARSKLEACLEQGEGAGITFNSCLRRFLSGSLNGALRQDVACSNGPHLGPGIVGLKNVTFHFHAECDSSCASKFPLEQLSRTQ